MPRILVCIATLILVKGCTSRNSPTAGNEPVLYRAPVTFALNTSYGYAINQLTSDSIKPIINSFGDTIKTGVSIPFTTSLIGNEIIQPTIIKGVQTVETIIQGNVYAVSDKLSTVAVDTSLLKRINLGEGNRSHVVQNNYGIVATGERITVTGKKVSYSEPYPVKAEPMRQKDEASTGIQFLDVDQGMSYSYVYDVCEDSKGHLWFAMDASGVCKYDGINITNYTEKEGLSNNTVTSILQDRKTNLWFGTNNGATYFDGKHFTQYTEKEGLLNKEILSISEDRKGNIWFSSKGGLTKYNGNEFIHFTVKEGLPCDTVYQTMEDRDGNIWIATHKGLLKFNGNTFIHFTEENGLISNGVTSVMEGENGLVWIGSNKGMSKFDGKTFTHFNKKEGLSDNSVWSLMKDRRGNLWISTTEGGLNKFDGKVFTHYKLEQGISKIKIRRAIEDRSGNIWFGTDGGGVNKLNINSFEYRIPEEVMENNRIRPILKDKKGNLWFGTEAAHIGKLNAHQNSTGGRLFSYYKIQDKLITKGQRSLLEDSKGNIWVGTTGAGIIKYSGKRFTNYSLGTSLARQSIYDIKEDHKGNIWFGIRDGSIVMYDGKSFIQYTIKGGLPGTIIYSILEDKKKNLWFCTEEGGIYKYDGKTFIIYAAKEGLFNKSITSIAEDHEGNLWLGTLGAGVCKFNGKRFTYYSTTQGLADNNVWSLFFDSTKQLWIGTDKGLTLFIPKKEHIKETKTEYNIYDFGLQDGLKAVDFNLHSFCVDDNNIVWWGTGKNVPSFDLNKGFHAESLRSLQFSHIEINERAYDFRNFPDSLRKKIRFSSVLPFSSYPQNLSLPYDQNHLTFHFSAIDWLAPHKIKYSYRLIGLDKTWSKPSEEPKVDYRNLGYGSYQFQVKAIGQSQEWTAAFTYGFVVRPAWWQTWWFKLFIVLGGIALLIFALRQIYLSRLRKQKTLMEKELAVQLERQRISSEMHDDIGAGLSGVRLLTEITRSKLKDADASTEIDKIYESVGEISAKMKEVIWSLNTENDDLESLIAFIQKQTRAMLEYYPCELHLDVPASIPSIDISGEARRNIYLTVKEVLHNIIKHSGADKIQVTVTCNDKLSIRISDNGKGFSAGAVGKMGNGLKNMQQRMEKLNGRFIVQNNLGTTITLEIPLKKNL